MESIVFNNDFLLEDRLQKIRQIVNKYGEENFYITFSGGKDSTVLSALVDMAIPGNKIPRVYANTGIELNMIRDFVVELQKNDDRIIIIKPSVPIKEMLEKEGYPFKSKEHSLYVSAYQKNKKFTKTACRYLHPEKERQRFGCPNILRYQFTEECKLKISDKCCDRLKEDVVKKWSKENNKLYAMVGVMREEGGRRNRALCLAFNGKKLKSFQPLVVVTKDWEDWFVDKYNIKICDVYKPPYNFKRTGCKGCPFNPNLEKDLKTMQKYFPAERKQCEIIWKPVYDEYRRIGYRLKPLEEFKQMEIEDYLKE